MSTPTDAYAALRQASYRRFVLSFMCSSAGLQMLATAVGWEIYELTNDPLALGLSGLARVLPVVVLALPAGAIVDRFDRRRVLALTQLAMGLGAALLAVASAVLPAEPGKAWLIYGVLMLMGCARAFNGPARSSLLPLLVVPGTLTNAVTWNSAAFHASALGGPILAGVLLAWLAQAWVVYALAAAGCLLLAIIAPTLQTRDEARSGERLSVASVLAGARHIYREKTIFGAMLLDLLAVLLGGATALLPIFARDILQAGPVALGALKAAPYAGAVAMSFALAHLPPIRRSGPALLWSVAVFGVCTIGFGLSTSVALSLGLLFVAGAADNISVIVRHVLVQTRTPNELRGRVGAVNSVFIECSNELGAFESGLVARLFTPVISVVSGGIGTLGVVAGIALRFPQLRRLGRLEGD